MSSPLSGQVALVTGASSGIGAATALALAVAGAQVTCVARRRDRLDALVEKIAAAGGTARALPGDVADAGFVIAAVDQTAAAQGRLDILVNAAGLIQPGNVGDADLEDWQRLMDVHVMATLRACRAALGPMRAQRSGCIVNIGSLACRTTSPVFNPYATSKAALYAMTDGLRQEVGPAGIRVCLVAPGPTRTEVADGIRDAATREAIQAYTHQPGALDAANIADTIVFVVSQPPQVNISEIWVRATTDTAY